MKITKSQLKQIIKEELETAVEEGMLDSVLDGLSVVMPYNPRNTTINMRRTMDALYDYATDEEIKQLAKMSSEEKMDWAQKNMYRLHLGKKQR